MTYNHPVRSVAHLLVGIGLLVFFQIVEDGTDIVVGVVLDKAPRIQAVLATGLHVDILYRPETFCVTLEPT